MRPERLTIAEAIARAYGDDGQVWEKDGIHIETVCGVLDVRHFVSDEHSVTKHVFADGSAILLFGGAWDIGHPEEDLSDFSGCYCTFDEDNPLHDTEDCPERHRLMYGSADEQA